MASSISVWVRPDVQYWVSVAVSRESSSRGVVAREVHVAQGVGDFLVRLGSRVEVQEGGDDLGVDLAAVVVARQGRADAAAHGAVGGVVGQLSRHVAGDLALVPVGHQLAGDERQHLGLRPVLGQIERVDGGRDRSSCLELRVGLAAGIAVRLDQNGVV